MNSLQMVFFKVMVGDVMSAVFADEKQAVDHAKCNALSQLRLRKFLTCGHKYLFTNNAK